jgi:hypothetical protein
MREIPLTRGKVTMVDDADFEWLNQWKWFAHKSPGGHWYAVRARPNFRKIWMHRLILDTPDGLQTDHRNNDGLDNQRHNIRTCSPSQNQHNQTPHKHKGTSVFKGVSLTKERAWKASIGIGRQTRYLGVFPSEIEAALAYDHIARELFGDFAYTNFIEV